MQVAELRWALPAGAEDAAKKLALGRAVKEAPPPLQLTSLKERALDIRSGKIRPGQDLVAPAGASFKRANPSPATMTAVEIPTPVLATPKAWELRSHLTFQAH